MPLRKTKQRQTSDESRRQFLIAGIATTTAVPNLMAKAKAVAASANGMKSDKRHNPITPPGSVSREHFLSHCTSCHLCVSKCPSHVLKPALMEYGIEGIMQPTVSFEKGFCNFDCTVCSDICPNGAILPLTKEQKHITQMGKVVFIKENCIVYRREKNCGACSEHCPTQAISMVPYKKGLTIPHVNTDICVGCGGCEYVCPAYPFRAVHIEGNTVQQKAKPFTEKKEEKIKVDDFGF
jgi:ferredoxin-type protein NapF